MKERILLILLLASLLPGCRAKPLVEQFKLGMTKDQVAEVLGAPMTPRGMTVNKFDQVIEVFQYEEFQPEKPPPATSPDIVDVKPSSFYLFFYNNQLVQWGEADDWREVAKLIYETRFW